MKRSVLFALVFILAVSFSTMATTYYVDKNKSNASDNNPGTAASPFKTIQKGINVAQAGDIVLVKSGTYSEKLMMQRSGTSTKNITIAGYNLTSKPVIDGSSVNTDKLINWSSSGKNYIILDGFEIKNAKTWAIWLQGNYNTIRNCKVHDIPRSAVNIMGGNYNLISKNEIYNVGNLAAGKKGNNIDIESFPSDGKTADYNTVEYNNIHDNASHFGINIFPEDNGNSPQTKMKGNIIRNNTINKCLGGIYTRYQINFEIYNNVVSNNLDKGIWFHIQSSAPASTNTFTANGKIYNNTIVGNKNRGLENATSNYLEIKNNIFINNGQTEAGGMEHLSMDKTTGQKINNNVYYGTGRWKWNGTIYRTFSEWKSATGQDNVSLTSDPKVESIANRDFRLKAESPAIDKGINLASLFDVDIFGNARPSGLGFDIGAAEYEGTGIPPVQTGATIALFAEDGTYSSGTGKKARYGSMGSKVGYSSTTSGTIKLTVNVPASGTWYVWGRFYYYSANNSGNNAFYINADNSAKQTFGNRALYNQFHWDANGSGQKLSLGTLSAGTHTITITGKEPGSAVMLDMVVLTDDPSYIPTDADFQNLGKVAGTETDSTENEQQTPEKFELSQNYPNPFNPATTINYSVAKPTTVTLKIYDVTGQEVATLVNGMQNPGSYQVQFNGSTLASGMYIYRLQTNEFTETKKMMLLK